MDKNKKENSIIERPPVVVIMGHIDHGKSTLLDYIRKTNIVAKEAGGITQAISAYEVTHKDEDGIDKKITFIDTPGHESFSKMRERGAMTADIAILIVSAEDGVKPQTLEAKKTIEENNIPFLVAINKIDKPNANIEKTKIELAENEVYLENYGGKTPVAEISAKTGEGVDNLLSLINIMAMMEDFKGEKDKNASGFVLEANLDQRRGIEATLIIKNGTLEKGMVVVVKDSLCSTNIMENFLGKQIKNASFSSPIRLVGWSKMPEIGTEFISFKNKKEAEAYINENKKNIPENQTENNVPNESENKKIIPIILKADTWGSIEAIEKEINKIQNENAEFKIIQKGIGPICEFDVKTISSPENILVVCFNVKTDKSAMDICLQKNIQVHPFDIIYKMTEWLRDEMENRKPKIKTLEITGRAKILKVFSKMKDKQIAGGKVLEGRIVMGRENRILRRESEIGKGEITNLEKNKTKTREVEEGTEFGLMIESKTEIAPGDFIESFCITEK